MSSHSVRAAALIALCFVLSGCASWQDMTCPPGSARNSVLFNWVVIDDPHMFCTQKFPVGPGRNVNGCVTCREESALNLRTCTVYLPDPRDASDVILGHEVKHMIGCRHA